MGRMILIVEDDEVTRKVLVNKLKKMGLIVFQSNNGKNAFEILEANDEITLLITDIMMPDMNGTELVKLIRGKSKFNSLPIIMMSGIVGVKEISTILKLGATWFIAKPINNGEFKELVTRALEFTPQV